MRNATADVINGNAVLHGCGRETDDAIEETLRALQPFMRRAGRIRLLTPEQERALGLRAMKGDREAIAELVTANIRWAVKVAIRQMRRVGSHMELDDVIAEGICGLIHAASKFDPSKGRFTTYATFWSIQFISRASMNQRSLVRIPAYKVKVMDRIRRSISKLEAADAEAVKGGGDSACVSDAALAERLGVDRETLDEWRRLERSKTPLSMCQDGIDIGGDVPVQIPDDAGSPYREIEDDDRNRLVREMIAELDEEEGRLIRMRFGIGEYPEPMTFVEIAAATGLSMSETRRRYQAGMAKLRQRLTRLALETGQAPEDIF